MNKTKLDSLRLGFSMPIAMATENINFFIGLPLNIFVLYHLTRTGGLDVIFTLSQIATEILFAIPAPLFILCYVNVERLCFNNPIEFITGTCLTARFLFQCCVCFERYMAVVHPVTFRKYKVRKYRRTVALAVWIHAIFSGFINVFWFADLPADVFGLTNALLLGVMLFFNLSILKSLRRPAPGARERDDGGLSVAKRKAFKVVSINLLMCVIQSIPIMVCFGLRDRLSPYAFALAFMVSLNIIILISLLQPVVILYQNGKLTCRKRG